jgi:septum site-determining protein MinC
MIPLSRRRCRRGALRQSTLRTKRPSRNRRPPPHRRQRQYRRCSSISPSGQSLFHEGDVTIIGSVSSGAEIVATGSIHIYGTLRGRVLAGADGNPRAHIFCRRVEAELIAIDGYYRMADEMAPLLGKPIHAWLEDGALAIKTLD